MPTLHLIVLALVQGLTEFLPVSSSGHLVLLPVVMGWEDQGLAYDVAAHLGTLLAVTMYFRVDLWQMASGWFASVLGRGAGQQGRLAWLVILATLPAGIAGLVLHDFIAGSLRGTTVIAITTIVFGIALWLADVRGSRARGIATLGIRDALLVGIAQALALVPGTSRSGITMTAGLMLGLDRQAAARFSFLMAVPVIALAALLETWKLAHASVPVHWGGLVLVTGLSALAAWLCIHVFLRLLDRIGMAPFALYRLALGVVLLLVF